MKWVYKNKVQWGWINSKAQNKIDCKNIFSIILDWLQWNFCASCEDKNNYNYASYYYLIKVTSVSTRCEINFLNSELQKEIYVKQL